MLDDSQARTGRLLRRTLVNSVLTSRAPPPLILFDTDLWSVSVIKLKYYICCASGCILHRTATRISSQKSRDLRFWAPCLVQVRILQLNLGIPRASKCTFNKLGHQGAISPHSVNLDCRGSHPGGSFLRQASSGPLKVAGVVSMQSLFNKQLPTYFSSPSAHAVVRSWDPSKVPPPPRPGPFRSHACSGAPPVGFRALFT